MYLSKKDLAQKENLSQSEADVIWRKYYFCGWNHILTWGAFFTIIAVVFIFAFPSWLVPSAVIFSHAFVAIPIASKVMRKSVQTMKNNVVS
ncbi:hypothetical protein L0668_19820 [Paraglaciecola aquimarina]|uniref:Uncharacterized protein n=1 Tax=Paraglaciecola algarum TaxID=3050085 RepID=A0ABS9DBM4_9ALTE|nr:hypothetical protein [Paraglaciecola sp. G1-23]MCF2950367.1 hypothetical protein [Paraglaciecola sp. G1-23]